MEFYFSWLARLGVVIFVAGAAIQWGRVVSIQAEVSFQLLMEHASNRIVVKSLLGLTAVAFWVMAILVAWWGGLEGGYRAANMEFALLLIMPAHVLADLTLAAHFRDDPMTSVASRSLLIGVALVWFGSIHTVLLYSTGAAAAAVRVRKRRHKGLAGGAA